MTHRTTRKTNPAAFKSSRTKAARSPRVPSKGAKVGSFAPDKAPTKLTLVTDLLARPHGASIEELSAATGWQAHSVRGAMAGALKRKGLVITSEKHDGMRRYRIGLVS